MKVDVSRLLESLAQAMKAAREKRDFHIAGAYACYETLKRRVPGDDQYMFERDDRKALQEAQDAVAAHEELTALERTHRMVYKLLAEQMQS